VAKPPNKIIGTKKNINKKCMIATMVVQIFHNPFFLLIVIVLWHFLILQEPSNIGNGGEVIESLLPKKSHPLFPSISFSTNLNH